MAHSADAKNRRNGALVCSPIHSKTETRTTSGTICAHTTWLRTFSMIVVVWAQRVVQPRVSRVNMNFQLKRGDLLHTFKTQQLVIRCKRCVTGCLIVRRRACSPRWHARRVPQTEVSERLVLIRSPVKKHVVFNNTSAHDCGQPCLHCTSTAYCG